MQTILFVGGGSVGHIAPSVAVWEHVARCTLQVEKPATSNQQQYTPHFVCANREDDKEFLEKNGLPYTAMDAPKMSLLLPLTFLRALWQSWTILQKHKPSIIFSKGGYVSVPLCLLAWLKRIPIVLHESDALMGRANAFIAIFAKHICLGFAGAQSSKLKAQSYTGNPIRKAITQGSREEALRITGFSGQKPVLMVIGGSQGAKAINDAILDLLPELTKNYDVLHVAGRHKKSHIDTPGYWSCEFSTELLPHLYALADKAVSRSGAGSIAELAACEVPTVLVPLMNVPHPHQHINAQIISEESDLFTWLYQEDLQEKLLDVLNSLPERNKKSALDGEKDNSAERVAKIVLKTLASHR